jgi:hypothetical protein
MEVDTRPEAVTWRDAARRLRGSTGDAIAARASVFPTMMTTDAGSGVQPFATSSAKTVAYRVAPDPRAPT